MLSTQPLVYPTQAERWSPMELCLQGPSQGNPFMEQSVTAVFRCSNEEVTVSGFYDGDGVYRVRFMPSFQGTYSFTVTSTFSQPLEGTFQVPRMLLFVLPDPLTCHWVAPGMMSLGIRQLHTDEALPVGQLIGGFGERMSHLASVGCPGHIAAKYNALHR